MQHFCNSWHVRNLLVMVLRLSISLKLAESIVSLHPHQAAQAQHQLWSLSMVYTPLVTCRQQCPGIPRSAAPNFHAKRSSPQTAGNLTISNYTILNTFKLPARRVWLLTGCPDVLNLLSLVIIMLTKIHSNTWIRFRRSNTSNTSPTRRLNHCHNILCRRNHTPAPALCWSITFVSHGNATLRVSLRWSSKRIPTPHLWRMKSTNISSVGSSWGASRHSMTMCRRKKHCSAFPKLQKWRWRPEAHG